MTQATIIQSKGAYYKRTIKCPLHFLIPPNVDVYKYEPVALLKNVSKSVVARFKVRKNRIKKDAFGRPQVDWRKMYDLERKGIVKQPWITNAFALEHIYDPKRLLCLKCQKCKEGMGTFIETKNKRLNGSYYTGPDKPSGVIVNGQGR